VQGTMNLTRVLYVHGLHRNLISTPKLIEKGLTLKMLKHQCIIESKRGPVMAIPKSGSFYVAECLTVVRDTCAPERVTLIDQKVTIAVATNVGHQRLGHLSTKAIVAVSKKEIV